MKVFIEVDIVERPSHKELTLSELAINVAVDLEAAIYSEVAFNPESLLAGSKVLDAHIEQ